jgi:hypothetical protein
MALIVKFTETSKDRNQVHDPVECGYLVFEHGGERYVQLDTYGSSERVIPGKVSQSIQFDAQAAAALKRLIDRTFPGV